MQKRKSAQQRVCASGALFGRLGPHHIFAARYLKPRQNGQVLFHILPLDVIIVLRYYDNG